MKDSSRTIDEPRIKDVFDITYLQWDEMSQYQDERLKWKCILCGSVMDKTNFRDFVKQSDHD